MYADYDSTFLKPIIEGEKANVKKTNCFKT